MDKELILEGKEKDVEGSIEEQLEAEDEKKLKLESNLESTAEDGEEKPIEPTTPDETSAQEMDDSVSGPIVEEPVPEIPIVEENGAFETSIKTFTQEDVDKLVGDTRVRTREKTFRYIYDRYGVKDEEELDSLIANAQRYDTQKEMYENDKASWEAEKSENASRLGEMSETIALMQSEIDPARYEDAKLILKGKGMEITLENIQSELETHPEWKKVAEEKEPIAEAPVEKLENSEEAKPTVTTRITTLGNEPKPAPSESEEEMAEKLFKMKFHG